MITKDELISMIFGTSVGVLITTLITGEFNLWYIPWALLGSVLAIIALRLFR